MSTLLWVATLSSSGTLIYVSIKLIQTQRERNQLQRDLRRYESLTSREETEKQLDSNIQLKQSEQEKLKIKIKKSEFYLRELLAKEYLIKIDEYEPKYDFVTSQDYQQQLQQNRLNQERMLNESQAYICDNYDQFALGKSTGQSKREIEKRIKAGNKLIDGILETVKLAFEEQCQYAIKQVSYNNADGFKRKMRINFKKINKYLKPINFRISEDYLELKLEQLYLKHEHEEKCREENERKREIQKQIGKEKKDRDKIEKARIEAEEAEEREKIHQQELEKVRQEMKQLAEAEVEQRKQLELKYQQLEQQIAEDKSDRENAISRSQKIKSGHIYVISNIGSLGRDIYRIFMTQDSISIAQKSVDQNSNSDKFIGTMRRYVPFPFEIHFKIFSEDALETIQYLHQHFNDRRVNIVNERRDFFKVELSEIEQVIREMEREKDDFIILSFEKTPQAYEYKQTQSRTEKI